MNGSRSDELAKRVSPKRWFTSYLNAFVAGS